MLKQPFCNFILAGLSISEFGLQIPSPFASLELSNSEITSATQWTLRCVVGGDDRRKINVAAFEALLYSAAQESYGYDNSSGIPVSFMFGWLNNDGSVSEYTSYQGFTLKFNVNRNTISDIVHHRTWKQLKRYAELSQNEVIELKDKKPLG